MFLGGRYEVQILDTYGHPPEIDGAGAIYQVAAPRLNASLPPEQWQSYDIQFRAARFRGDEVVEKPRVTVVYNGVKIHEDVKMTKDNTTAGLGGDPCTPGPIMLQDHGNPVQFRNVWILQLKE